MKELVQEKLSALHEHLELQCADISIVTFNWFLTFFIDALPTEVSYHDNEQHSRWQFHFPVDATRYGLFLIRRKKIFLSFFSGHL